MKFSYAIFDMDGLMFDTENLFVRAFEEAIGPEIGYRFSREKMKQLIGLNHQAALETFPRLFPGCPAPCEACLTRFRAWMQEYIRENGIPVTEETWARILQAEKENVQKTASKF